MKKSELSRALLQNGLTIRPQALDDLVQYLMEVDVTDTNCEAFEDVQMRLAQHSVIRVEDIEALRECRGSGPKQYLAVLNVIRDLPHFTYDLTTAEFIAREMSVPDDNFTPVEMMQERLLTVKAALRTNKRFQTTDRLYAPREQHVELITVDALVGSTEEKIVLGLLTKQDETKWMLEDATGYVKLNLSCAASPCGYFPSGSVVIVQGGYEDGLFNVREIVHPPMPGLLDTKVDLFGTKRYVELAKADDEKVVHLEAGIGNMRFVFLADIHLDSAHTFEKLTRMFEGYQKFRNLVFVLMGDFLSTPTFDSRPYILGFQALFDHIAPFSNLRDGCYWVLLPGPNDIGLGAVYPKDSLPSDLIAPLAGLPHLISASNPCRLDISGKRMVFFSTDFVRKLRRTTALAPSTDELPSTHLVQTLLCQLHLLPGRDMTTAWEMDHTLRLLPLPDVLCYADKCERFIQKSEGCLVFNPASFTHDSTFVFLNPAACEADESCV